MQTQRWFPGLQAAPSGHMQSTHCKSCVQLCGQVTGVGAGGSSKHPPGAGVASPAPWFSVDRWPSSGTGEVSVASPVEGADTVVAITEWPTTRIAMSARGKNVQRAIFMLLSSLNGARSGAGQDGPRTDCAPVTARTTCEPERIAVPSLESACRLSKQPGHSRALHNVQPEHQPGMNEDWERRNSRLSPRRIYTAPKFLAFVQQRTCRGKLLIVVRQSELIVFQRVAHADESRHGCWIKSHFSDLRLREIGGYIS